jgi:gamma-glutamyltranspeptidase / glutathione hydrolase
MSLTHPLSHTRLFICLNFALFFLGGCTPSPPIDARATPESSSKRIEKQSVHADNVMISVANPYAADAGLRILKKGGSAVDAAIAAQMVLNLVEPQSSGIGGGGFLLVYDPKTQKVLSYDGRETAPENASSSLFLKKDGSKMTFFDAIVGGRAVGVPGLLQMLSLAHRQHGKLKWQTLFDDAITLSKTGFPVSERLHSLIAEDKYLTDDPSAKAYFMTDEGKALPIGYLLKNPDFANTLQQIKLGGAPSLYIGQLADKIVDKVQSHPTNPGLLSLNDMQNYQAKQRESICLDYKKYTLCGMPPPSSGGLTVLETLGLIDQFEQNNNLNKSAYLPHLFVEASKLAFADRNQFIADPDFIKVPTHELLSQTYLKERASLIKADRILKTPVNPGDPYTHGQAYAPDVMDHGISTTHMSIVDDQGMVVSMTTSIENAFGSRQMVGGFLLNNQLSDFSFSPTQNGLIVANRVEPHKRPRSSMAPTIVLNKETGQPVLAIGSPGGSRIIGYVAQSLLAILDEKRPLDQALAQAHITNRNGATEIESDRANTDLNNTLKALGHEPTFKVMTSGLHAIQINEDGTLIGAADPRREGVALGY